MRAKLYGALLYYLQIAQKPKISLAHLQGKFTIIYLLEVDQLKRLFRDR